MAYEISSGGSGGIMGFSEAKIKNSLSRLQTAYNKLYTAICDTQQSKVVNELTKSWYCEEAVTFFKNYKSVMDGELVLITSYFNSIMTTIKDAAKSWAQATGSSVSLPNFSQKSKKLDVSGAKKQDSNGNKGANQKVMENCITAMEGVKSTSSSALSDAKTAVRNSGFYDKNSSQQSEIETTLKKISETIQSKIDSQIASLKKEINSTISKYGGIISKNSINFKAIANTASNAASGTYIAESDVLTQYWDDDDSHQLKATVRDDGTTMISEVQADGTEVPMGFANSSTMFNNSTGSSTGSSTSTKATTMYDQDAAYLSENKSVLEGMPAVNSNYSNLYEEEMARLNENEGTLKNIKAQETSGVESRMSIHLDASKSSSNTSSAATSATNNSNSGSTVHQSSAGVTHGGGGGSFDSSSNSSTKSSSVTAPADQYEASDNVKKKFEHH